jgi:hypothetical protein
MCGNLYLGWLLKTSFGVIGSADALFLFWLWKVYTEQLSLPVELQQFIC